ncbi:sugar ABC transporter substrate-binding protein [Paenibacillus daejeonensis]|uniref:sugar ABC transporter substrate-binding protein n=1 Tax=Paenibacillus daejeonensis TaxID=135193 RepID=UPI00037988E6|nr:extracellular solute-binding protein [Paenibacillus daejeonensis]
MTATRREDEIVLWHEFDGPGDTSVEVLNEINTLFTTQYGIKVRSEVMGIAELGRRLTRLPEEDAGVDMALVPSDMTSYWEASRFSPVLESWCEELVPGRVLDSMRMKGRLYGIPVLTGNHLVLYYNKQHYAEAPEPWEAFEQFAAQPGKAGIVPLGLDIAQAYNFIPFLTAFGGWPEQDGRIALDTHEVEQAITFLQQQWGTGTVTSMDGATELLEQFIAGQIGAIISGEWIFNHLSRSMGERLGVGALPRIHGAAAVSMCSSVGLVFPGQSLSSSRGGALAAYARFMLGEECQRMWAERVQRIPANEAVMKRWMSSGGENRRQLVSQLAACKPMPCSSYMIAGWVGIEAGLTELADIGPSAIRSLMQKQAQQVMAEVDHYLNTLQRERISDGSHHL